MKESLKNIGRSLGEVYRVTERGFDQESVLNQAIIAIAVAEGLHVIRFQDSFPLPALIATLAADAAAVALTLVTAYSKGRIMLTQDPKILPFCLERHQ